MTWIAGITTLLVAFALTAISGKFLIPFLRKLKFGQTIKEIGPTWHEKKNGTPTMGGIMFAFGSTVALIVGMFILTVNHTEATGTEAVDHIRVWSGLAIAFGFGLIGFIDDFIKVVKKRNLGLTAKQKTVFQLILCIGYVATLAMSGAVSTTVIFPFIGQFDFGWVFYPLVVIGIYFVVNAVNLTDGIDGLASSVTVVYAIVFMILTTMLKFDSMYIFAAAIAGGCLGFLVWNFYPAKVFMGDTGSMFLGGAVVALAFGIDRPMLIVFAGIIYIIEALSVVLQVISFKTTGKRIFKMSPIHHHFEMCNWSEIKIVSVFTLVTALFGALGIFSVFLEL
ncbi:MULTISPECIES: phospho-N-acetylmuramoyl-pentapeptide-transferase [Clostridiaceae]